MESISVFEIIKVGIGPSSSHTMGPWNAASSFLNLIKRERQISEVKEVFLEFFGSLAKTGIGHGTDIAGMLGLSGENFKTIDTTTIDEKIEKILEQLSAITNLINTNLDYEQKQNKRLDFLGSEVVWLRTKHIGLENAFGVFAPLTLNNIKLLRLIISIVAIGAALGIYLK